VEITFKIGFCKRIQFCCQEKSEWIFLKNVSDALFRENCDAKCSITELKNVIVNGDACAHLQSELVSLCATAASEVAKRGIEAGAAGEAVSKSSNALAVLFHLLNVKEEVAGEGNRAFERLETLAQNLTKATLEGLVRLLEIEDVSLCESLLPLRKLASTLSATPKCALLDQPGEIVDSLANVAKTLARKMAEDEKPSQG